MKDKKNNSYHDIGLFILYAFTIPLVCICIMNCIEKYDKGGLFTLILYGIEGASPALAAIFAIMQKQGINGVPFLIITIGKLLTYLTPYNN